MVKSIAAQINAMRHRWPNFEVRRVSPPKTAQWIGDLNGVERQFTISIYYGQPLYGERQIFRYMPVVRVLSPKLVLNPNAADEAPLPHVYLDDRDPELSPLCLYDPRREQWNPTMLIATTIVPWAERWLWFYELWEANGHWRGGGAHPETEGITANG